jgi:hypothetical protein
VGEGVLGFMGFEVSSDDVFEAGVDGAYRS